MTETIMTEEEIRLMSAVYGDAERLRQGKLYDYQKTALDQLRAGLSYLDEKYAGYGLEVLSFSPANKANPQARFVIRGEDGQDCTLIVEKSDGGYVCMDDCYGRWIREEYDAYVAEVLRSGGVAAQTYTSFTVPMGMEIGPRTTAAEFVAYTPRINRQTRVYVMEPADLEAEALKIRALLRAAELYGHYFVYAVPADSYTSAEEMEGGRKNWESTSFNCYDV